MTFEQYILNPMGKNNAVMSAAVRELTRKSYIAKFDNILLRENGRIQYFAYKDSKSNTYWLYIKVPSEVVKKFYYDVVLKFSANQSTEGAGQDLFKYNVQFFSNDPAFVFTYANVFAKNNLFIKELSKKMSREALKKLPVEKNPSNVVGYVKSLYFAYLVMQNRKLNKVNKFEAEAKPLDFQYLFNQIENADSKIERRQEEGSKISGKKKINVDDTTLDNLRRTAGRNANFDRLQVATTKRVRNIKNSAQSKNIKSTRQTKRSGKK